MASKFTNTNTLITKRKIQMSMFLDYVDINVVIDVLNNLKNHKRPGIDEILEI